MYALDKKGAEAARKSDTGGGQIKEIGKYVGSFTQAFDLDTTKGGKGISLSFVSDSGQKANLPIYTMGADGKHHGGYETLMAIMTCMGLRNITPKSGVYTTYDFESSKDVQVEGKIFPELLKPIGILLETEDDTTKDGKPYVRVVLKHVFQHDTELTASEILDRKTQPEQLAKMVAGLRHRSLKGAKPMPERQHGSGGDDRQFSNADIDEIPF